MNIRAIIAGLNPYASWVPLSKFPRTPDPRLLWPSSGSLGVWLLPNAVVKKAYDVKDQKQVLRFERECEILTQLSKCEHTPKLLFADKPNCTIYMTYCGPTLPESLPDKEKKKRQKEIAALLKVIEDKHRVKISTGDRAFGKLESPHSLHFSNVTTLRNKLYIIDFGAPHWKILPPKLAPLDHPIQDPVATELAKKIIAKNTIPPKPSLADIAPFYFNAPTSAKK